MKEQIERIECGTDDGEYYTLICGKSIICFKNGETESDAPMMPEMLNRLLEQVCVLIAENPDAEPAGRPYHSAVYLNGDAAGAITLPYPKLHRLMTDAWFDAKRMLASLAETQLMGLVQCQTPPPAPFGSDMMSPLSFMGMKAMPETKPQTKKSVRTDNETWNCCCGQRALHSKFCPECGRPAPPPLPETWDCPNCCKKALHSRFCPDCGTPAQAG